MAMPPVRMSGMIVRAAHQYFPFSPLAEPRPLIASCGYRCNKSNRLIADATNIVSTAEVNGGRFATQPFRTSHAPASRIPNHDAKKVLRNRHQIRAISGTSPYAACGAHSGYLETAE